MKNLGKSLWVTLCFAVFDCGSAIALDEFADLLIINRLPASAYEIEAAHRRSRTDSCEMLEGDEPVEFRSFTNILTKRDQIQAARKQVIPSTRQSVFSVGLMIEPSDQRSMPTLSRSAIVDYLETNFVMMQARVRRDLLDRQLYYHHRPIALTSKYRGGVMSESFEPVVAQNIQDFHSLGLFCRIGQNKKPENLRTIVLLFKSTVLKDRAPEDLYEFAFIRGRQGGSPDELEHHVFITIDGRHELVQLNSFTKPFSQNSCSIIGSVVITDYDAAKIYPKKSSIRDYQLDKRSSFELAKINELLSQKGFVGGFNENVDIALDMILDGVISAD